MTSITIDIPDERLRLLEQRAHALGLTIEDLLRMSLDDMLIRPQEEMQQALDYVLRKNAALYQRLA
jgi:antitoxin FitA